MGLSWLNFYTISIRNLLVFIAYSIDISIFFGSNAVLSVCDVKMVFI